MVLLRPLLLLFFTVTTITAASDTATNAMNNAAVTSMATATAVAMASGTAVATATATVTAAHAPRQSFHDVTIILTVSLE